MHRTLLTVLASAVLFTGCQRDFSHEDDAVVANYPNHRDAVCPSWLYSNQTGQQYCSSPKVNIAYPLVAAAAAAPSRTDGIDTSDMAQMMALGETVYGETCAACHQANGEGVPGAFPPLKGAGGFYGDATKHAGIIINGISGEITVAGVTFNGAMPPQGGLLNDIEIAAVATYERNSWGNSDGMVSPEDVAAAR